MPYFTDSVHLNSTEQLYQIMTQRNFYLVRHGQLYERLIQYNAEVAVQSG